MEQAKQRQAHAVLDTSSRVAKAKKIEILMQLGSYTEPLRVLEIGCGSGGIAYYFATLSSHLSINIIVNIEIKQADTKIVHVAHTGIVL